MNYLDWVVGIMLIVSGSIVCWSAEKSSNKLRMKRIGVVVVMIGTFLSIGRWMITQIVHK
ncbi:MAG: hypothetical protein NT105_02630 [Verrucomicrobia bacterium]|nr:hypothetical protein [Verrucomicrobiota bacterium]